VLDWRVDVDDDAAGLQPEGLETGREEFVLVRRKGAEQPIASTGRDRLLGGMHLISHVTVRWWPTGRESGISDASPTAR
jgi:hypothetical protein